MRIKTTTERGKPSPITKPSQKDETVVEIDLLALRNRVMHDEKEDPKSRAKAIIDNFDITDRDTWFCEGTEWNDVFEADYKVYWVPTNQIEKDKWSQNRKNDSNPNVISQYANHMEVSGQQKPFCVWPDGHNRRLKIRWGNTRKRGQDKLYAEGRSCLDLPPGLSRVVVYDRPLAELPAWQSKENHGHTKGEGNDLKSDIANLKKAIDNGMLNYGAHADLSYCDSNKNPYSTLSDDEKMDRLKVYCKKFMILRSGPQFGTREAGFYKAFVRTNQDDFDIRSWTPGELRNHFLKANPLGINASHKVDSTIKNCYEKDGIKYGVWFSSDILNKGAYIQQAIKAKYITKSCDETIFVTADPARETAQISDVRTKTSKDCKDWNKVTGDDGNYIDHSLHAPLTEEEENSANHWSVYNKY